MEELNETNFDQLKAILDKFKEEPQRNKIKANEIKDLKLSESPVNNNDKKVNFSSTIDYNDSRKNRSDENLVLVSQNMVCFCEYLLYFIFYIYYNIYTD